MEIVFQIFNSVIRIANKSAHAANYNFYKS